MRYYDEPKLVWNCLTTTYSATERGKQGVSSIMTPTGDQRPEGARRESIDSIIPEEPSNQKGCRRAALAVMGHRIEIPSDNDGGLSSLSV